MLQFTVDGTVNGATVTLYVNDTTVLASVVATGTTTTITTSGTLDIADGVRSFTVRQTEPGKSQSPASPALGVTIDTVAPTATVVSVTPDPRTTPVPSITINFSRPVTGFNVSDVRLFRNGNDVPLGAPQAPTTTDNQSFTIANLEGLTDAPGTYQLLLSAIGAGISEPTSGNALFGNASDSWLMAEADTAPFVTDVFVASTAWTGGYRNSLQTGGAGEAAFGYRIDAGEQTRTMAWSNLNQISIRFNEDVVVAADDLVINGVTVPLYELAAGGASFSYDAATFTATWTLNRFVPNEKLTLNLDGDDGADGIGVKDTAGNLLDGEWTNPAHPAFSADSFPSGDGSPGGDFAFNLRVLPGDINRDGAVNLLDYNILRPNLNTTDKGVTGGDVNGDGLVSIVDYNEYRAYLNKTAPV